MTQILAVRQITVLILSSAILLGCETSQNQSPAKNTETSNGTVKGTLSLQKGAAVTADPILQLSLDIDASQFSEIKVSNNDFCGGGEWFNFSPDMKIMSPKVNETVTISVQLRNDDGLVSDCMVDDVIHDNPNTPELCEEAPEVCNREPEVSTPGVVTILLALGDTFNQNLIVNGTSAQVIAETAIRYASPVNEPKILVVRDRLNNGESYSDTTYIALELLKLYESVTLIDEPVGGLQSSDTQGYDLIWFNNPGYPMGNVNTRNTLINFVGGVVLSGDDMTWGNGFSMEPLTGLKFIDNGTSVQCAGANYNHDNNSGYQFSVLMDSNLLPTFPSNALSFQYGNDIDNSVVTDESVEVISWATGGHSSCTEKRPAISRKQKSF